MRVYKNIQQFYRVLAFLAEHEEILQSAWEKWNNVQWQWDKEFEEEDFKIGDCIVLPDYSIQFCESGWGDFYALQYEGWVLYERERPDLEGLQFFIEEHLDMIQKTGEAPEDDLGNPPLN